jgi:hypothetical protein
MGDFRIDKKEFISKICIIDSIFSLNEKNWIPALAGMTKKRESKKESRAK